MNGNSNNNPFNLGSLVTVCRNIVSKTNEIIKGIYEDGDLKVVDKALGNDKVLSKLTEQDAKDPTTVADTLAQKIIVSSIKYYYPKINICGEEGNLECSDDNVIKGINTEFDSDKKIPEIYDNIKMDQLFIWVDPVDGTKEFTEGIKEAVTTLVGIAYKGRPICGIIGRPFTSEVIWGIVGLGAYGLKYKIELGKRDKSRRIICTSRSHFSPSMRGYISACNPSGFKRSGGAGGKVLMVIEGDADAYVFPSLGTKKWDTCAPEAILLSLGGRITKPDGTLYNYDKTAKYMNTEGFVATVFDKPYHDSFLEANIKIEQLDLILFGATGFTGKLAAEYIVKQYKNTKYTFGFSARNMDKLNKLLDELKTLDENIADRVKLIQCNSNSIKDCENLVRKTACIITTVGPYALYGENLIHACCKYGVDYVDLTGEYLWVSDMIKKYGAEAKRSSSRIVNFGGVVSCMADCVTYSLVKYMQETLNVDEKEDFEFTSKFYPKGGQMSGGTTASWLNGMKDDRTFETDITTNSYYLIPMTEDKSNKLPGPEMPTKESNDEYSFPWIYGGMDRMVICRSNYLFKYKYGKSPRINFEVGYTKSWIQAWMIYILLIILPKLMKFKFVRLIILGIISLLKNYLPKPGDGPTRDQMNKSTTNAEIKCIGLNSNKSVTCTLNISGDIGYLNTAKMLVEEGMIFALQRKQPKLKIKGGFITPGYAFKDELLKRLNILDAFEITYKDSTGKESKL